MKKILLILSIIILVGCTNKNQSLNFKNKLEKTKSYYAEGTMEIINDQNKTTFNINVSKDNNNYKVDFINTVSNYEQIILKNETGTYVISPKLNKSYKFNNTWPDNTNQIYLIDNIIKNIDTRKYKNNKIETKIDNNKQIVYFKNNRISKIEIRDKNDILKIRMIYKNIDFKPEFDKDYFKLDSIPTSKVEETSNKLDEIIYPMYMPLNTYLDNEEKTNDDSRVILTFGGEKPFTIIEDVLNVKDKLNTTNMNGDIVLVDDKLGSQDDTSITWIDENIEYFATSKDLSKEELLEVAKSMGSVPLIK